MSSLHDQLTMSQIEALVPSARRVLFAHYHLGGCSACAYQGEETLADLCTRNQISAVEVLEKLTDAAATDAELSISATELQQALIKTTPPLLVDIRTREEHEAVCLENSLFYTQELVEEIRQSWPKDRFFVLYDHDGSRGLDAAAFYAGHEFTQVRALIGGIDAWSKEIDPKIPRYRLEQA